MTLPARRPALDPTPADAFAIGARPKVAGKTFIVGRDKLFLRGVTYGTFRPSPEGDYPPRDAVRRDFELMTQTGINSIRVYTRPPEWLLQEAFEHGLWVTVGIPWEQHIAFLDDRNRSRAIENRVRTCVADLADHPAVLMFAVGNEIPASIVRWHGRVRIEGFLRRLYEAAKRDQPQALVTYVNYPTTEYLQLDFLDVATFNVYLEDETAYSAYLSRLQNIAADRPLVIAEIGVDSRRHGRAKQAELVSAQLRTSFDLGCAGTYVFSWTDEWHRSGQAVEDWDFGLTDRARNPKPALEAVRKGYQDTPFDKSRAWPSFSVVVCSYNGSERLPECLEHVSALDYPDVQVILVDDGSTDRTAEIGHEYGCTVIQTPHLGLSHARNVGLEAAKGDFVAYIDDDAFPDPHWLRYLALAFDRSDHAGIGGPNIAPADEDVMAYCVSRAPGGPIHVLLSDQEAEHIPGCNMAFRRSALEEIGGFDPRFRVAGDDVDVCWRVHEQGWSLGFSPGAVVWHRRRGSIAGFLRQQRGYGRAEALLEEKWPDKYNFAGHPMWMGRIYGLSPRSAFTGRSRIYHGVWGTAPFQSLHRGRGSFLLSLAGSPEWALLVIVLGILTVSGLYWSPLLWLAPAFAAAVATPAVGAFQSASGIPIPKDRSRIHRVKVRLLVALLHLLQPPARLWGRIRRGLTIWRRRAVHIYHVPVPRRVAVWSETWRSVEDWLRGLQDEIKSIGAHARKGGPFDTWDLEVRTGAFGSARVRMAIEEHGAGRQFVLFRVWPRASIGAAMFSFLMLLVALTALVDGAPFVAALVGIAAVAIVGQLVRQISTATAAALHAIKEYPTPNEGSPSSR